jgi:hypothetical protein
VIVATADYRELRPADPHALRKWREWFDERDRRFEQERQAEKQAQQRGVNMTSEEFASMRSEIENLRAKFEAADESRRQGLGEMTDAIIEVLDSLADKTKGYVDRRLREVEISFWSGLQDRSNAMSGRIDGVHKHLNDILGKLHNDLMAMVERRFDALQQRVDDVVVERPRGKNFKFAGEKEDDDDRAPRAGEIIDLPKLPRAREVN